MQLSMLFMSNFMYMYLVFSNLREREKENLVWKQTNSN